MNKFWNWADNSDSDSESELYLEGTISDESWFDDDITPQIFKKELDKHQGDVTVWINSPGGDVFAANKIYNMLKNHNGKITVKINALAASAATIVAMAGDTIQASPVSMMMIHNPSTIAAGEHKDLEKALDILGEVKESIINAYQAKTGLSHNKISQLMDDETWMNSKKALQLGFIDEIVYSDTQKSDTNGEDEPKAYKANSAMNGFLNKTKKDNKKAINSLITDLYSQKYLK